MSFIRQVEVTITPEIWAVLGGPAGENAEHLTLRCLIRTGGQSVSSQKTVHFNELTNRSLFELIWESMGESLKREFKRMEEGEQ